MKTNIHTIIKEFLASEIAIITAVLCTFVLSSGVVLAYGPSRPTYTTENPADHITFDSITNNASYGDERNFTRIKDASNTGVGGWSDNLTVQDGKEYLVRVLVHNNAASNLNLIAQNVHVTVNVPSDFTTSQQLDGFIDSSNASPKEVYDSAVMTSDKKFNIGYVQGSAVYYNNIYTNGTPLSDSIVTASGAPVGYESMDGNISGCYQYAGYATFKVKVTMSTPNFTVTKKIRVSGTTDWQKSITAQPGQKVDYQIGYENTGNAPQDNVLAYDKLPAGVKYVNNSTTLRNSTNSNGDGLALTSNDLINSKGINIGNYDPTGNAFVRFSAILPSNSELSVCGANQLINTATIDTQNGQKSDTAVVTINKTDCTVTELPTTGPAEIIAGLVGLAAITIGIVYYVRSRRDLEAAMHEVNYHPTNSRTTEKHTTPRDM